LIEAISGRTGAKLWRSDLRIPQSEHGAVHRDSYFPVCPDLDSDGRPEVVCVYRTDVIPFRTSHTLVVLSGKDGQVRWQHRLIDGIKWGEANVSAARFMPGIGDLDGDGVKDVAVWAVTPDLCHEIRAFSGVDGRLLWSRALNSAQENEVFRKDRLSRTNNMVVAVGDLDGDGKLEVIVQRLDKDQLGKESCEIVVLEGSDGKKRWSQRVPAKPFGEWADPTPFLLSGAGGSGIAVLTVDPTAKDQTKVNLVMLDRTGKECGRAPLAIPDPQINDKWNASIRLLPRNRLLLIGSGKLSLMQGGVENTHWTWAVPGGSGAMVDIIPPHSAKAETIVVQAGTQVYGVDAGTGKTIWICKGPGRFTHALADAEGLPRLLFRVNDNTVCLRAISK
jgi:outer membrane protein assembly factor BamB